jgi:hypothetical protein
MAIFFGLGVGKERFEDGGCINVYLEGGRYWTLCDTELGSLHASLCIAFTLHPMLHRQFLPSASELWAL